MNEDCLKLTHYFGERDRTGGRFLADALLGVYERRSFQASVLLRGIEGFGIKHRLQTQRLLTLSEDLPLVAVAVDTRERIQDAIDEITQLSGHGLLTLERARMLTGHSGGLRLAQAAHEATKLTVYCGRQERTGGRATYLAVVEVLHRHGVAGATVLLGVDGTAHGVRQRAQFFGRNADVPLMIIAVGDAQRVADVIPELNSLLARPLMTLEGVRVCKRDGRCLAQPSHLPDTDPFGLGVWQKLMVFAGEQTRHDGQSLYVALIRRLRREGAAGATALRGLWGYHGEHQPHGDTVWSIRRRVPVVTVIVDTTENIRRWFEIVDEVTDQSGLVTSEMVLAFRAVAPHRAHGGLRLAQID